MEMQSPPPAKRIPLDPSIKRWLPVSAILLLIALLFGVQAVVRYAQIHMPIDTPSAATDALLGGWREASSTYYDLTSTTSPQTTKSASSDSGEYLGFVIKDGVGTMRTYDSSDGVRLLSALAVWKIASSGNGVSEFETYPYGTSTSADPVDTSTIRFISRDEIVMRSYDYGKTYQEQTFVRVRSDSQENAMNFMRSARESQALCDEVLAGSTTAPIPTLLPLSCTTSIGPGVDATFDFSTDGSLFVTSRGKRILELNSEDATNTAELLADNGLSGPFLNTFDAFTLEDVTFDGYKDIIVLVSAGAYNFTYDYYAYDPKTGSYDPTPIVTATNPDFSPVALTITDFDKGRGLGDLYVANTYHFQDGAYVLVKHESQDFKDQENFDPSNGYVYTLEKLVNGKLKAIKTEFRSAEDVFGGDSGVRSNGNF